MADDQLKKMLQEAGKGKPRNFALAYKGSSFALFLSKKPIQPTMVKELKTRAKAQNVLMGVCLGKGMDLDFKSLEAAAIQEAKLKSYIKDETGLSAKPSFVQVTSLDAVDDDGPDFSDVEGGKSPIDVDARRQTEMDNQVRQMQNFVSSYQTNLAQFQQAFEDVKQRRASLQKTTRDLKQQLKAALTTDPRDPQLIATLKQHVEDAETAEKQIFQEWNDARGKVGEVTQLRDNYVQVLQAVQTEPDFDKRYDMLQPGRGDAIKAVHDKMEKVFADTNRRLAILGRTKHTFEGDQSWAAQHPTEKGRVLAEDDWSMAVNDAFIKAGLDQKADFAMITKFKKDVLDKIKELTRNPGNRTKEELKAELRDFVRQAQDDALYTGGRHNDGFAVSMIELEQLIDDGYVMMEHDPDARGKDEKDLKPEQVMVPSGKGQKIKEELAQRVGEREQERKQQRQRINDEFAEILRASKATIKDTPKAIQVVGLIKAAMDENRWDDAEKALGALQKLLNASNR